MKTKIISMMALAIFATTLMFAQKNVIKVKPLSPAISAGIGGPINLPLAYERVIIPRLSAQINFNYTLPSNFGISAIDFGGITPPEIRGFGFGPEVRFYPNIIKDTPRGIYLQAFLNFRRTSITSDFTFEQDLEFGTVPGTTTDIVVPYEGKFGLTGSFTSLTYGIGFGSQWLIADRVSIDILWFGIGFGQGTIGVDLEGQLIDVAQINSTIQSKYGADLPPGQTMPTIPANDPNIPTWNTIGDDLAGSFTSGVESIPGLNVESSLTTSANGVNVEIVTPIIVPRLFNFSIGFAF